MIYGIGNDIIDIERIAKLAQKHPRFLSKVFTAKELSQCQTGDNYYASLAVRFAAKEAVYKAFGGQVVQSWQDIEIVRPKGQPPQIVLKHQAAQASQKIGQLKLHLALSHSKSQASAMVIIEKL